MTVFSFVILALLRQRFIVLVTPADRLYNLVLLAVSSMEASPDDTSNDKHKSDKRDGGL